MQQVALSNNFRRANLDAMRTELDYQTFEQPIVRNNAELLFEILKNSQWCKQKTHPKSRATINNPSWINNDVKQAIGRRQRAYETKMKKLLWNSLQLGEKLREL